MHLSSRKKAISSLNVSRQDVIVLGEQPRSPARCEVRKRCRKTAKSVAMGRPCCEPRDDVTEGTLDLGSDVRVRPGGQPQVAAGVGERGMTHEGLRGRQHTAAAPAA